MINDNSNKIFCLLINNALKQGLNVDFDAQKYFDTKFERLGFFRMALAVFFKIKTVGRLKLLLKNLDDKAIVKGIGFDGDNYMVILASE